MSNIIKWFRQDKQRTALREEYQRQRIALPDLRQVLHRDTSDRQPPEVRQWAMPVKTLEQITESDQTRFVAAMIASTSKTITGMVCDLAGSDGKQSELMTHEQITKAVDELKERGVSAPFNCVVTPNDYARLIQSLRQIDRNQISDDECGEITYMMNICPGAHGLRRGSWRGVGIYVAQRCARSFVFGQGAIQYREWRDDQIITDFVTEQPLRPPYHVDLGDVFLFLSQAPNTTEVDVVAYCWPSVSIANKEAIVFIQTDE